MDDWRRLFEQAERTTIVKNEGGSVLQISVEDRMGEGPQVFWRTVSSKEAIK